VMAQYRVDGVYPWSRHWGFQRPVSFALFVLVTQPRSVEEYSALQPLVDACCIVNHPSWRWQILTVCMFLATMLKSVPGFIHSLEMGYHCWVITRDGVLQKDPNPLPGCTLNAAVIENKRRRQHGRRNANERSNHRSVCSGTMST
jgi:hypothetical protein